jgi:hypothetical protein
VNQYVTSTTGGMPIAVQGEINAEAYGAKHNGQQYSDGAINIGTQANLLTSAGQYSFLSR